MHSPHKQYARNAIYGTLLAPTNVERTEPARSFVESTGIESAYRASEMRTLGKNWHPHNYETGMKPMELFKSTSNLGSIKTSPNTIHTASIWNPHTWKHGGCLDDGRTKPGITKNGSGVLPITNIFKFLGGTDRMGKKKDKDEDVLELLELMGRKSGLRRIFRRNIDSAATLAMGVMMDTFHEFAENNLYSTLTIFGHYDTFISKSSVKVLLKYLWPKYGKHIIMDVDGNFSMCSISIEKIKKSVLGFPELVNKTIRPGIYWVKLSNVGKGTYMIVIKNKLYNEGDISENGIRSEAKNFKTTILFIGERKLGWKRRVQREIDMYCSGLVTTSASSDKIRVQSLGGGDNAQNDIIVRPMNNLVFPKKEALLKDIQAFLDSGKIYKENGIPYRKGYLFVGPRGTGKTSFAFSIAEYFHMECVAVDLSYFDANGGANAFNGSNTVYIIDEIDAQLPKSRVSETHEAITVDQQKIIDRLHKLLKAADDMSDGCIIIGTTNFPERLDPAITRSGRFDELIEFNALDEKYATMMCEQHKVSPKEVLVGESFPIIPAYLEQKLIDVLLVKNNIKRKELKSAEEIISEEYGADAANLSKDSADRMRDYAPTSIADLHRDAEKFIKEIFMGTHIEIPVRDFVEIVMDVDRRMPSEDKLNVDDLVNIKDEDEWEFRDTVLAGDLCSAVIYKIEENARNAVKERADHGKVREDTGKTDDVTEEE